MKNSFIKNSLIIFFVICVCALIGTLFFACDKIKIYTLTFIADDAVVETLSGKAGSEIDLPDAPVKGGFEFAGWYDDPAFGEDAQPAPDKMPAHNATFYAKYVANEGSESVGYKLEYYLEKLNKDKTATDGYELDKTDSFSGDVGSVVSVPEKLAYSPEGFERKANENEKLSLNLDEDESKNVLKVYLARKMYTVSFDANGGDGTMEAQRYPYGVVVSGNFENAFTRDGWRFVGFDGAYDSGDPIPNTAFELKGNATFKAIWHRGYKNADDDSDIVYFDGSTYYRMVDDVRENAELTKAAADYGFDEFVFEDGKVSKKICRLISGASTYKVGGKEAGTYLRYDYVTRDYALNYILSLDGFGIAAYSEILNSGGATQSQPGRYSYDDVYEDWTFLFSDDPEKGFYFDLLDTLPATLPETAQFDGSFVMHGGESGEFFEYRVIGSELIDSEVLQLSGDGYARVMGYDSETEKFSQLISEGVYYGTENCIDESGEWFYQPQNKNGEPTGESFKFVLGSIVDDDSATVYIYMRYEQKLDVELNDASGNGGKLLLGGYNAAVYTVGGTSDEMSGAISMLAETVICFTPYSEAGVAGAPINFDIDWDNGTFALNTTGLLIENGVLTGYVGTSAVIVIPNEKVTEIAADALSYKNTNVNLTHVTIPASVTKIGARAFENWYSLTTVVFEGEEPIEGIDWSDANNPFRWPMAGAFKIYVPDSALEAYKAAWTDCPYKLTSVAAEKNKPEFEVENGVLLSYNCKTENPTNLSIVLPDDVKSVAQGVFAYIPYIVSVDLKNATEVGKSAFEGCSGLVSVKADKLETVGESAFALCTSLESIALPAAKAVGAQAFEACDVLTKVSLGAGIERIGDEAFSQCGGEKYPALFVLEFAENFDAPLMGDKVFDRIDSGYRLSVATVADALALYTTTVSGWAKYAGRATVRANENSAIAGEWIDITTLLPVTVGGRLETAYDTYVYALEGETLTLYAYNGSGGYETVSGTYKGGKISFKAGGESYVLAKRAGKLNYETTKGETLVIDLDTYKVEEIPDSEGYAPMTRTTVSATFAGKAGVITVTGNSPVMTDVKLDGVTIAGAQYDAIKCNLTLRLGADGSFTYTTTLNDKRGPYAATDGSYVYLEFYGDGRSLSSSVCMTGCLKQFKNTAGADIVVETRGTWQMISISGDTYEFSYNYLNDRYFVTVTLDEQSKTFTYSAEKAASRVVLNGNGAEKVVVLLDKDGKTILSLSLMLPSGDGTDTLYVREFTLQADGSYIVEAEQREMVYDAATESYKEQLGPLSGTYQLTLNFESGTCTITSIGKLPE